MEAQIDKVMKKPFKLRTERIHRLLQDAHSLTWVNFYNIRF